MSFLAYGLWGKKEKRKQRENKPIFYIELNCSFTSKFYNGVKLLAKFWFI